jgi:acetyltransferase-like isoleucine patch superfamily enzyme
MGSQMKVNKIGENVQISSDARINVTETLVIGSGSKINRGVLIEGRSVVIGREAWIDEYAHIGGGSCFEKESELIAGDFLHMGKYSHVNTARKVTIGDEVGLGIQTKIFTHGAYLSAFDGFPVTFAEVEIGNRVWLPNAWVNPGVKIGDDVAVAAMSLVNDDIPSGSLAGGIPAHIIKSNVYPMRINKKMRARIMNEINEVLGTKYELIRNSVSLKRGERRTIFNLKEKTISGPADEESDRLRNQFRRVGIRFRYSVVDGVYVPW